MIAGAERLAHPLLSLATRVFEKIPPEQAPSAVAAVLAFTELPAPSRYLAAVRELRAAARERHVARLGHAAVLRRTDAGLSALTRAAGLPDELLQILSGLPPDPRNGRRLQVTADLLTAHRVLAAHAEQSLEELRRTLGPLAIRTRGRPLTERRSTPRRKRERNDG